jgi:HAD superfamily hydrolase (TIGR01509 family)
VIRALLFDFDGTIVDSEGPAFRSWQEVYRAHGQELPLERWVACVGTIGGFDAFAELEELVGKPVDREQIQARRLVRKTELVEAEPLRPGVEGYLREARRRGLGVGIVTSGPREWVVENLGRLGLSDGWSCILCADHEQSIAKPDPHLYREALAQLGIGPAEAIALEDSPNGIAAAKAAGLFCVAVPNPITAALDLGAADVRVESLAKLSLDELLRLAER